MNIPEEVIERYRRTSFFLERATAVKKRADQAAHDANDVLEEAREDYREAQQDLMDAVHEEVMEAE